MTVNIRNLAKKAGFSPATISRVLNNSANVNPQTRQKIRTAIDLHQFRSHRVRRKISALGIMVPEFKPGRQSVYLREFVAGVVEAASAFKASVKILDFNEIIHIPEKPGAGSDFCRQNEVGALIHVIIPIQFHEYIEKLAQDGIPQVVMDHRFDRPDIGWIDVDNYGCSFQLAEFLIKLKRSNAAVITASRELKAHLERRQGLIEGLRKHQVEIQGKWDIERQLVSAEAGRSAVMHLLTTSGQVPQAIFFTNVELALGGIAELAAHGLRIPQDVIPCLVDDSQFSPWVSQPVIYILQPTFDMGARAANFILAHKPGDKLQQVVTPELFIGPKIRETFKNITN
jgi:LacI family transcriptional regulator